MAIPTITEYTGVVPDRRTQSAEEFTSAAVTWTDYQADTLVPEANLSVAGINSSLDDIQESVNNAEESSFVAQAAANYQGAWFVGASVVKGESWSYNGLMWAANVTGAGEPQDNSEWFLLNSEPEISAIKVILEQFGYNYVGLFEDGFTYSQIGDAGVDANNDAWIYVGVGAPSKVVSDGTIPSASGGYERVEFDSANSINLSSGRTVDAWSNDVNNLLDFGAVGDGVADDTTAWSNFATGGSGLIPSGKYLVGGIVKTYLMPTFVRTQLNNHATGFLAFESNTTGYSNVAVGYRALQKNDEGFDNLAIGVQAMKDNTTGNRNTAIGTDALAKNTTGDHNLALGQNALGFNEAGTYNTALGIDALEYGDNNNFNTAIGQYAGLNLANSNNNTVIGYNTFQAAESGNSNVSLGFDTLREQDGVTGSTAIGAEAARDNKSGTNITAIGYRSARSNITGTHVTAIGDQAAFTGVDGVHNVAVGFTALYGNISGSNNVAVGDASLFLNESDDNVGVGNNSGYNITTGADNTFIGHNAGFSVNQKTDASNTSAIGRGAYTTKDNTVQLGNPSVTGVGVGSNRMEWLASIPTSGTWARGSVVWNLSVSAGGTPGWICVTAGTPGVWKAMANIAS